MPKPTIASIKGVEDNFAVFKDPNPQGAPEKKPGSLSYQAIAAGIGGQGRKPENFTTVHFTA